jgi:hypothetical protein
MQMNNLVSKIISLYFIRNLAPSVQSFNLLGFGGLVTGIIVAFSSVLTNAVMLILSCFQIFYNTIPESQFAETFFVFLNFL